MTDAPAHACLAEGASGSPSSCGHRHAGHVAGGETAGRTAQARLLAALGAGVLLVPLLVAHMISPAIADQPGGCPLLQATGVPCPACGATRAFVLLAHGDAGGALRFNWAWLVVWLVAVIAIAVAAWRAFSGRQATPEWLRSVGRWLQTHPVAVVILPFALLALPWAVAMANIGAIR